MRNHWYKKIIKNILFFIAIPIILFTLIVNISSCSCTPQVKWITPSKPTKPETPKYKVYSIRIFNELATRIEFSVSTENNNINSHRPTFFKPEDNETIAFWKQAITDIYLHTYNIIVETKPNYDNFNGYYKYTLERIE